MKPRVRWTRCWHAGCTLWMRNGYDHPGMCNVIVEHSRKKPRPPSTFAILDALPPDLLAIIASAASVRDLLHCEQTSRALCTNLRESESAALIWHAHLCNLLDSNPEGLEVCVPQLDYRALYRALHGTLEVKGWASSDQCTEGDMNAWWRCRAVGLRAGAGIAAASVADALGLPDSSPRCRGRGGRRHGKEQRTADGQEQRTADSQGGAGGAHGAKARRCGSSSAAPSAEGALQVRVRYVGYTDDDDEWRETCSLRRSARLEAQLGCRRAFAVDERIECSAPPCPGQYAGAIGMHGLIRTRARHPLSSARMHSNGLLCSASWSLHHALSCARSAVHQRSGRGR